MTTPTSSSTITEQIQQSPFGFNELLEIDGVAAYLGPASGGQVGLTTLEEQNPLADTDDIKTVCLTPNTFTKLCKAGRLKQASSYRTETHVAVSKRTADTAAKELDSLIKSIKATEPDAHTGEIEAAKEELRNSLQDDDR